MSQQQISHNESLSQLQSEGYNVSVEHGRVIVRDVPYVTAQREVKTCLLSDTFADVTGSPPDHTMWMAGDLPCDEQGRVLEIIFAGTGIQDHQSRVSPELILNWQFSVKPVGENMQQIVDTDYYSKFLRYIERLGRHVDALGVKATARTYPVVSPDPEDNSVFRYIDTATVRANIASITKKLELQRIAIVGVGGTGSYILDLIAKTPVREIHLYDPDEFHQHNAFRAPGAPSIDALRAKQKKADFFAGIYDHMRKSIISHPEGITRDNVAELTQMSFVFLALDAPEPKRWAIDTLVAASVPFIECGMGLYAVEDKLAGSVRATTVTPAKRDHIDRCVLFTNGAENNEYARNIQIADLNALNAALAVIRWKKLGGFYNDLEQEHDCVYTVDGNALASEERP